MLNWRDPWHPKAGGAESLTLSILEKMAVRGWNVDWFSALYPGAAASETRNGIRFIRAGKSTTVHLLAFLRFFRSSDYTIIVDQINTIPFYSPFYKSAAIAWFQQLAREVWLYEGGPFGAFGYVSEPLYLVPYNRSAIITISRSSALSLRQIGFKGPISEIPIAVDEVTDSVVPPKSNPPDIITVSRLTPSKRIGESILAARELADSGWSGKLRIVGGGPPAYQRKLEVLANKHLPGRVVFEGRVTLERRRTLLRDASVLWMTSVREGWGLVVTEAACHGTPAVVYDVPGLRDAVKDGKTGVVVSPSPTLLAAATRTLLDTYAVYSSAALKDSRSFSLERTVDAFETALIGRISQKMR